MANVFIKGTNGKVCASTTDYLLKDRIVTLEGEITECYANEIIRQLLILGSESQAPITMIIDSPGGSISAGLAIIDVMQMLGDRVRCVCTCLAASMAAVIFAAGSQRLMLPHSRLMLHQARVSGQINGGSETLTQISKRLTEESEAVNTILAESTGKTVKEIKKACSFDNYMSPEEAIAFGIADEVINRLDMIMEVVK